MHIYKYIRNLAALLGSCVHDTVLLMDDAFPHVPRETWPTLIAVTIATLLHQTPRSVAANVCALHGVATNV
jgi:hypothetical protein